MPAKKSRPKVKPAFALDHSDRVLAPAKRAPVKQKPSNKQAPASNDHVSAKDGLDAGALVGRAWIAKNRELLAALPPQTIIAINIETGEYVTALDGVEVMDLFEAKFPGAIAWIHYNNGPIRVGAWL